jgi:hypothetical protein
LEWKLIGNFTTVCCVNERLVYFVVIWYIFPFWYFVPRKIWQPWRLRVVRSNFAKVAALKKCSTAIIQGGRIFLAILILGEVNLFNRSANHQLSFGKQSFLLANLPSAIFFLCASFSSFGFVQSLSQKAINT